MITGAADTIPTFSREIGMVRVSNISLQPKRWTVDEVVSKCYISPLNPKQRKHNPLPDHIRMAKTSDVRQRRFNSEFELEIQNPRVHKLEWNVVAVILPPKETVDNLVTD